MLCLARAPAGVHRGEEAHAGRRSGPRHEPVREPRDVRGEQELRDESSGQIGRRPKSVAIFNKVYDGIGVGLGFQVQM